uniref:Uncharacterized protein n=1 Tax=Seriola lalandi dorsalis TaxID=1841481 RepID=A0A3B4Y805_SERLL
ISVTMFYCCVCAAERQQSHRGQCLSLYTGRSRRYYTVSLRVLQGRNHRSRQREPEPKRNVDGQKKKDVGS